MTILTLLQQLHTLGVMLTPYPDGTVHYKAPKGVLTPALGEAMRQHKERAARLGGGLRGTCGDR